MTEPASRRTRTIYARVPIETKDAVDAYAEETGKTLAGAVSELLARGLTARQELAPGGTGSLTRAELDLALAIIRIKQMNREEPADSFLWHRIVTCDVPRLMRYLGPAAREIAELEHWTETPDEVPANPRYHAIFARGEGTSGGSISNLLDGTSQV